MEKGPIQNGAGHEADRSWRALLPDTARVVDDRLAVAGCGLDDLAASYGTPLYVYDEATLRGSARHVLAAFRPLGARLSFATKACSTLAILRIFREEGLDLDVVSEGELEAALRAGFDPARIHFHGNCKTDSELETAARLGLHAIVIDNALEIERLEGLSRRLGREIRVMVRLALSLEAETHPYLQTSGKRTKFGIYHPSGLEDDVWTGLERGEGLRFVGLHVHLGSQVGDASLYARAAEEIVKVATCLQRRGLDTEEISLGGGWKVAYTPDDDSLLPEGVAEALRPFFGAYRSFRPAVEPGRALVARAGIAVYRVGAVKISGDGRLVAVDGGMGDNPRPALYGARYSVLPVSHPFAVPRGPADVVGRYCESGDILVRGAPLTQVEPGDLVCVPVSGAYQLSMVSTYNLVPPPAVVLVADGHRRLITRRATIEDMLSREIDLESSPEMLGVNHQEKA